MNKKILIIGDMHIDENSIPEIDEILQEIYYEQKEIYDSVWFLGDIFDRQKPTPMEYDFVTKFLIDMKNNGEVIICTGNHDDSSKTISALNYTNHLGIKLIKHHGDFKLKDKSIYLGHHFVDQSDTHYKDNRFKVKELSEKFDICFTGHDHKFNQYTSNFINLGSIRRQNFGESEYGVPKYCLLCPQSLKMELYEVKSAIPMIDVTSIEQAFKIDSRTKLRLIFTDFDNYMESINKLPKLSKKFHTFKVKHNYVQRVNKVKKDVKKGKSFEEMFSKFLKEKVKNKEVEALIKENL